MRRGAVPESSGQFPCRCRGMAAAMRRLLPELLIERMNSRWRLYAARMSTSEKWLRSFRCVIERSRMRIRNFCNRRDRARPLLRTRMHPSRQQAVRIDLGAFIELHGVLDQKPLQAALFECIEGFTGAADELAADEYLRDRLAAAALAQYGADLSAAIVALVGR